MYHKLIIEVTYDDEDDIGIDLIIEALEDGIAQVQGITSVDHIGISGHD